MKRFACYDSGYRVLLDMNISLVVESICQSVPFRGGKSHPSLSFKCVATEGTSVLEIGKTFAFASKGAAVSRGRTHISDMWLRVRRKSALTEADIVRLTLSDEKIGELGFYPPHEETWDVPAFPATLEAFIFVDDHCIDETLRSISTATGINVSLYVEKPPSMKYGWEPDGSRVEWAVEKPKEPAYAPISQAEINVVLYKLAR